MRLLRRTKRTTPAEPPDPGSGRCTAIITRTGQQCKLTAEAGSDRCVFHLAGERDGGDGG